MTRQLCRCNTAPIGRCTKCYESVCPDHSGMLAGMRYCAYCYPTVKRRLDKEREEQRQANWEAGAEARRERKRIWEEEQRQARDEYKRRQDAAARKHRNTAEFRRIQGVVGPLVVPIAVLVLVSLLVVWYLSMSVGSLVDAWPYGLSAHGFLVLSISSIGLMSWGLYKVKKKKRGTYPHEVEGLRFPALAACIGASGACVAVGLSGLVLGTLVEAYIEAHGTSAHNLMGLILIPLILSVVVCVPLFFYYVWQAFSVAFREMP